jgi:predicted transcriptional regulator
MYALTIQLSEDVRKTVDLIANEKGVSPEGLLSDMATEMVRQYDAFERFREMQERGKDKVDVALAMLRRE